jgi:6-phosphogluconolactonase (cycloisomerase 2 family)
MPICVKLAVYNWLDLLTFGSDKLVTRFLRAGLVLASLACCFGCGGGNNLSQRTASTGTNSPVTTVPQVAVVTSDKFYNFLEDASTGGLTTASGSPLPLSPGVTKQCATSVNNDFLLVTRNTNTLTSFALDGQTGAVKLASTVNTGGFPIATVEVGGKLIYVATTSTQNQVAVDNIVGFRLDPTSGSLQSLGVMQQNALWEAITVHPNGRFIYAADEVGRVLTYGVDQNTAALTPVPGATPTTYTDAAQGFAFTPDGNHLLATGVVVSQTLQTTPAMFVFQVNANTGALTPVAGSPFTSAPVPSLFVVHPNGQFVYGVTGDSALTSFTLDSAFSLHVINTVSVPSSATALSFDRSGSFLYVLSTANAGSGGADELTTYQMDATTGGLHQVGAPYAVPSIPACVLAR